MAPISRSVPQATAQLVYACGQWEIDLGRRELRSRGIPVPLGGRAFEIVTVLVQSAPELVTNNHMMDRVWPGATVSEGTLHVHISAVRKALGPDRAMLKTTSGRGYRLLGSWTARPAEGDTELVHSLGRRPSGTPPANNFPPLITQLVGRAEAGQSVRDLVSAYRVVTLTGPGGIGKTSLAIEATRSLLPDFEDGGWIVELASLSDADLVPSTVAAALGLKLGGDISTESIARAIGGKHILLVLDNSEHVIDAVANLAEAIARSCARTTIVATSREILRINAESVYRVPPLDVPAAGQAAPDFILDHSAVQLFVTRTKALNAGFSPSADDLVSIATICRRLDGIPLAIEFAAVRAGVLGVELVAAGLRDRFALLTAGRRTALPRHRTLRATLDWSHDLLSDAERRLLRRLAVFSGGFTIDAAAAVMTHTGLDVAAATDGIANLISKSWIVLSGTQGAARWQLLETTRAYAIEKLVEHGEADAAFHEHAAHFRDLFNMLRSGARSASSNQLSKADLARGFREIDNVRAALDWAYGDGGDPTLAVDLTEAVAPVWIHHLLIDECRERLEQAVTLIDKAAARRDSSRNLRLFSALAVAHMQSTGDGSKIDGAWSRVAELAEEVGDREYRLKALWGLWIGRYFNRDYRGALQAAVRFASLPDEAVEPADRFVGERIVGVTLHILGDQARARSHIENMLRGYVAPPGALHLQRYQFDQRVAAGAFYSKILWLLGFPDQSMTIGNRALDDAIELGDDFSLLSILAFGLCPVALERGDFEFANELISRMFKWAETFRPMRVWGQCYAGVSAIRSNDTIHGLSLLREGLNGFAASGYQSQYLFFLGSLATGLFSSGNQDEALATLEKALDQSERDEDRWYVAELLRIKGEFFLRLNERRSTLSAEDLFSSSLGWARKQGALSLELRTATGLARLRQHQGREDEARELLEPIYLRFTEGYATKDLVEAASLLKSLGVIVV